ncbi:CBS domain-containing protein [Pollutibacter soli]|uniref:CBS domain-containing protein n=1 Tax=Pollutibacter soli TaxID=3034157 RepID=UPI0030134926
MVAASDVLLKKSIVDNSIEPGAKVIDALNRLNDLNLSYLVVQDGDDVVGIFSERDYARKVILKGRNSTETTVAEVMSTDMPEVDFDAPIETCMHLLASMSQRYLIVKEDGEFRGVITIHDLLREVLLHVDSRFDDELTKALIDINEQPHKVY